MPRNEKKPTHSPGLVDRLNELADLFENGGPAEVQRIADLLEGKDPEDDAETSSE